MHRSISWRDRLALCLLFIAANLCSAKSAYSYPQFVVHGYTTCASCHYNPMGGGALTDYGRALGATLISGRPPWYKPGSEEKMAEDSGFLGPYKLPFWLRPSIDVRELNLRTGIGEQTVSRWIEMQQEANVVIQSKDSKWFVMANYGHIPVPAAAPKAQASQYKRWVSREHYLGVKAFKRVQFYLGLMDPAFGLRLAEHSSYILTKGSRNTYDQNHGMLVQVSGKQWDAYLNPVIGNLQQDPSLRRKGVFATFEYEPVERARFGVSVASFKNDFQERKMLGFSTRLGLGKNGAGLLAELSFIHDQPVGSEISTLQEAAFLQATALLSKGVYLMMTFENFISDFKSGQNRYLRAGPAIQWFPFQRLEFRSDFLSTRSLGSAALSADDYSLLVQMHVWL